MEKARERAAEIAARLAAFQASRVTPLPSQEDIQARVAAARMTLQQQQQQQQVQQPSHGLPLDKQAGRGGIKMGLHPLLMSGGPTPSNTLFVPRANVATLRSNQRHVEATRVKAASMAAFQQAHSLKIEKPSADFSDPSKNPYFDPNLAGASGAPKQKFPRNMRFAPKGKFIEQANQLRAEVCVYYCDSNNMLLRQQCLLILFTVHTCMLTPHAYI